MKQIIALLMSVLVVFFSAIYSAIYITSDIDNNVENEIVEHITTVSFEAYETNEEDEEPDLYEIAINEMQKKMKDIEIIDNRMEWYIEYKTILQEYSDILDPPETIYDYFTQEEINLICRVVETETFQCDFVSKIHIANVVFNRLENGSFGETIKEVVTAKNQFAYGRKNISEDTILAVEYAFEIEDMTNGALFFHSNKKTESFCGANYIFSDDAVHHFYK